jgi:CTD small phosphatase-like protein 2
MNEKFEVVIFTAARQDYADNILDRIDPEKKFFSARLYR